MGRKKTAPVLVPGAWSHDRSALPPAYRVGCFFVRHDGNLCVAETAAQYSEPKLVTQLWFISNDARGQWEHLLGREVTRGEADAHGFYHHSEGATNLFCLPGGADARPVAVLVSDYPCPKVRKGLTTYYREGRWLKFLKKGGWVQA